MSEKEKRDLFEDIYDEMADSLYRHCFFRVNNKEIAEDLVSESFMKFWKEIQKGSLIDSPKSWLYHIARNSVIDYYRKKKSISLDMKMEDGFDTFNVGDHESIEMYAEIQIVMKRIDSLSENDREIALLRFVDGLEVKEIAKITESNANAVSVRLHRIIEKLKQ